MGIAGGNIHRRPPQSGAKLGLKGEIQEGATHKEARINQGVVGGGYSQAAQPDQGPTFGLKGGAVVKG
jgi:hypothetical protein